MPENIRGYYNLGLIYQNLNRIPEAETTFRKGLAAAPEDISLHNALAILYLQNDQKEKARPHVEFLSKQFPDNQQVNQMLQLIQ